MNVDVGPGVLFVRTNHLIKTLIYSNLCLTKPTTGFLVGDLIGDLLLLLLFKVQVGHLLQHQVMLKAYIKNVAFK